MNYIKYWIALEQAPGVGPAHMLEIYNKIKGLNLTISDLFGLNENEICHEFNLNPKLSKSICQIKNSIERIESDYIRMINSGINITPFFSNEYPKRLMEKLGHGFPPLLYTFGNTGLFNIKGAALLGDKDLSDKGDLIAYSGAKILARHKICVISGFAKGAGMTAHRAALENEGSTIAFVPYGMNHLQLPDFLMGLVNTDRILIASNFYPSKEADKYNAYIRNKIICAISYAVYIIEAPESGGILEAAKSANNLGIPLFTTEYGKYPVNAPGNKIIIDKYGGLPVKGKIENNILVPNLDKMIGMVKFG